MAQSNDNDDIKWLYGKLKAKGYNIGSEAEFKSSLANSEDRKWYYEKAKGMGLNMGSMADFDGMYAPKAAPKPQAQPQPQRPAATAPQAKPQPTATAAPAQQKPAVAAPAPSRPAPQPKQSGNQPLTMAQQQTAQQIAQNKPKVPVDEGLGNYDWSNNKLPGDDYTERAIEDYRINSTFTPKKVESTCDIQDNYADMFALTQEGEKVANEYAEAKKSVMDKYVKEFDNSKELHELASKYRGRGKQGEEQLTKEANDLFVKMYGNRIEDELKPYNDAYNDAFLKRYGHQIDGETGRFRKGKVADRVTELNKKVDEDINLLEHENAAELKNVKDDGDSKLPAYSSRNKSVQNQNWHERARSDKYRQNERDLSLLKNAKKLNENSARMIDEAGKKDSSWYSALGRGLRDSVFDVDTWSFGVTELNRNLNIKAVAEKAERGEKLTKGEEALMDACVANMATEAYYSSDLSASYRAGQTTGTSLPFMLEFAVNPVAGAGNAFAKSVLKYGMKKFGTFASMAARRSAKVGARLVGDAIAAGAMTATTGVPRVAAGTVERMTGDIQFDQNDKGELSYAGRENQKGLGEALARSYASQFLENQSEMIFNPFEGTGGIVLGAIGKGFEKVGKKMPGVAAGYKKAMNWAANTPVAEVYRAIDNNKKFKEIMKATQFHGYPEEYMEEVYNNFANVALGEMSLEDATSLEQNLDTMYGLAPTSVAFAVLGVGMTKVRHDIERRRKKTYREFLSQLSEDDLRIVNSLKDEWEVRDYVKSVMRNANLTPEQKKAELRAAYNQLEQIAADQLSEEVPREENEASDAYNDGAEQDHSGNYRTERRRAELEGTLNTKASGLAEMISELVDSGASAMEVENVISGLDRETEQVARDYYHALLAEHGAIDNAMEEVNATVDDYAKSIEGVTDEYGNVTTANYKDEEVHVLSDDGEHATILHADGRKEMVLYGNLSDMVVTSASVLVEDRRKELLAKAQEEMRNRFANHPNTREPEKGMQLWNGNVPFIVGEVRQNADGTVTVTAFPAVANGQGQMEIKKGSTPIEMTHEEAMQLQNDYYDRMDDANGADNGRAQVDNVSENGQGNEGAPADGESTVQNRSADDLSNGEPKPIGKGAFGDIYDQFKGKVKEAFDFLIRHKSGDLLGVFHRDDVGDIDLVWGNENGGLEHIIGKHVGNGKDFSTVDEAMRTIERVLRDGEIIQDGALRYVVTKDGYRVGIRKDFDGEKKNWVVTAIDYNRTKEEKGITTNPTSASHGAKGSELAVPNDSEGEGSDSSADVQGEHAESGGRSAMERMPKDEKGNPLYEQADAETAFDALAEQTGDAISAQEIAESMVKDKEAALKKLQNAKPKAGLDVQGKIEEQKRRKADIAKAQEELDKWRAIAAEPQRRIAAEERRRMDEERAQREAARKAAEAKAGEQAERAEGAKGNLGRSLTKDEADELLSRMEEDAEVSTEKELTAETWNETFDENNSIETPIGHVKMGENQITKFFEKNREKEFGMVAPTLRNPDVIIEEKSEAKDGVSERPSSFLFVKTFNRNGEKIKFYASITVKQDGMEVSISSHYINKNRVGRAMQEGKVLYTREALLPNSSEWHLAEHQNNDVPDLLPTQGNNASSAGKVTNNQRELQTNNEESADEGKNTNSPKKVANKVNPKRPTGDFSLKGEETEVNADASLGKGSGLHFGSGRGKNVVNPNHFMPGKKDKETYPRLLGIHYENGYAVATDTHKLAIIRCDYPTGYEGKTISPKGEEVSGEFPDAFGIIPKTAVPFNDAASIINEFDRIPAGTDYVILGNAAYLYETISPVIRLAAKTKNAQLFRDDKGEIVLVGDGVFSVAVSLNGVPNDYYTGDVHGAVYDIDNQKFYPMDESRGIDTENGVDKDIVKKLLNGEVMLKDVGGKTILVDAKSKPSPNEQGDKGKIASAEAEVDTKPTEAQKEAGNNPANVDRQGNPLNADGTLKLDKVGTVDELTDEDFTTPTRNVELPKLPPNVDAAIGADGKPVVVKKNIFEKNKKSHKELSPRQSREILSEALYHPDLYGQNKKTTRPYNWILIHNAEKHSSVILEVSHNKDNVEIVNWHYLDDVSLKQKERQAEKEGGLILTLGSAAGNALGGLSSAGEVTNKEREKQGKGGKNLKKAEEAELVAKEPKPRTEDGSGKIDDYGEKIAGARKDMLLDYAKSLDNANVESFVALPLSKAFKRPNLKRLVEEGALREKDARFAEAVLASYLSQGKPKQKTRSRYAAMESGNEIRKWAEKCAEGADMLRTLFTMDEAARDKYMDEIRQRKAYDEEAVNERKRKLAEWNPGRKFEGTCYGINPVALFMDVYGRLGYDGIGEVKLPVAGVAPDSSYGSYELIAPNGKKFYPSRPMTSYEDVVNETVYQAKRRNGDVDNDHPESEFIIQPFDPIEEVDGYKVLALASLSSAKDEHHFKTKEEADAFAKDYNAKHPKGIAVTQENRKIKGYGKYAIVYKRDEGINNAEYTYIETELEFATMEEARAAIGERYDELNDFANGKDAELAAKGGEVRQKKDYLRIQYYSEDGGKTFKYAIVLDDRYSPHKTIWNTIPYALADGFTTRKDAQKYVEEHRAEWDGKIAEIDRQRREFVYFDGDVKGRIGEDYRKGQDVTAEQFATQFGFRGVQFGNWANQRDRQAALNNAFDGFMDLARLLGVSPRAVSLNGELGIAFGARGSGNAAAHYERDEVVINLTKTMGAGSLAHEWWHALDNYFGRQGGVAMGMVSENKGIAMRKELREAFNLLIDHVAASGYDERSAARGRSYWGTRREETARLFETWVNDELRSRGERNHFLVGKDPEAENKIAQYNYDFYVWSLKGSSHEPMGFEEFRKTPMALSGYVYPSMEELETLGGDLRHIFDIVQERVDEETGNVVMYHRGNVVTNISPAEAALRDAVTETMRKAGMEVVTDVEEGQRVLDMANGEARMEAKRRSDEAERREKVLRTIDEAMSMVTGKPVAAMRRERRLEEEKIRAERKELYERVLSGNFDEVTLRQIQNYIDNVTPDNPYRRPLSQRLPPKMGRSLHGGTQANHVDVLFGRISESAVGTAGKAVAGARERRQVEEKKKELLKGWAIATGHWHTDISDFVAPDTFIGRGKDSDVYLSKDGKHVIKVSRGKEDLKKFAPDIDTVSLFNYVFPNSRYDILGYGEIGGKFVRFLRQPIVDFSDKVPLSAEERVSYMEGLGFHPINKERTAFSNGTIVAADLQKGNIVKDKAGNISVIDADMKLHTKEVGGNYSYPPVERDTDSRLDGVREHRVFHGSGADFDAFDHSHMGEGEGAQAYGWGTYVTEVKGIGKTYAKASADKARKRIIYTQYYFVDKKGLIERLERLQNSGNENLQDVDMAKVVERTLEEVNKYQKKIDDSFNNYRLVTILKILRYSLSRVHGIIPNDTKLRNAVLEALRNMDTKDLKKVPKPKIRSHLYTVEIPDDTSENYLDWDKPLTDGQKDVISKAIKKLKIDLSYYESRGFSLDGSGKDAYEFLSYALRKTKKWEDVNAQRAVSKFLSSLGFTGIKYPAEYTSGGREDGAKNYVIFNEADAKITDHVRFFRTPSGEAYGYTVGNRIYIDPRIANSETPIHEYAHLWATALRKGNEKEWKNVVGLMKGTPLWDEVKKRYPELETDDDVADEVLAHYSGRRGAERLREAQRKALEENRDVTEAAAAVNAIQRVRRALQAFWKGVADFLHIHYTSAEEVADRVMRDLLDGVDPRKVSAKEKAERLQKLRDSAPVEITGQEIAFDEDLKKYKRNALEYGKKLQGEYVNKDTGETINLQRGRKNGGINEVLQHNYKDMEHLQSIAAIPQIIENSVYISSDVNRDKAKNPNVSEYQHYVCGLKIGGKDYTVHSIVAVDNRGNRYYDHNLTHIEKGKLLDLIDKGEAVPGKGFGATPGNKPTTNSEYKYNQLVSILQADSKKLDNIRFQFIGEMGAEAADRAEEVNTRLDNLSVARAMEAEKKDAKAIKMATGWERGADGKWRYEIADAHFKKSNKDALFLLSTSTGNDVVQLSHILNNDKPLLSDWIDANEIFKAYPQLKRVRFLFDPDMNSSQSGYYSADNNAIVVNANNLHPVIESTIAHEIQHAIQRMEGFARGGNMKDAMMYLGENKAEDVKIKQQVAYKLSQENGLGLTKQEVDSLIGHLEYEDISDEELQKQIDALCAKHDITEDRLEDIYEIGAAWYEAYQRIAGEVEARNVQSRMHMSEEERRRSLAAETEDVAREDQIFLYGDGRGYSAAEGVRFREDESAELEEANERFNRELERYGKGEMDKNEMFHLGSPKGVMRQFLPDLPIVMRQRIMTKGSVKKHNVDPMNLSDMPKSISRPIFVFQREGNALGVLTEMKDRDGKNICVAISLNGNIQQGRDVLEVNDIRSVHGRNVEDIVYPIVQNGTLRYADKEKGLAYLSSASRYVQQEIDKQDLLSATKIVENFENPRAADGKVSGNGAISSMEDEVSRLQETFHTPVRVVRGDAELTDDERRMLDGKRKAAERRGVVPNIKGWFDPKTGGVVIYLPGAESADDVRRTFLHEVVGHKGLRMLLGADEYDKEMGRLLGLLPEDERKAVAERALKHHGGDMAAAMDEYLAEQAEKDELPRWWERVVSAVREMLRRLGVRVKLTNNDVRYLLWRSRKGLADGVTGYAEDVAMRRKWGIDGDEIRFRDVSLVGEPSLYVTERRVGAARDMYERRLKEASYKLRESYQDSMLGLKEMMDAIERGTRSRILDFENPYIAENALSSRNLVEMDDYTERFFKPMLAEVKALMDEGAEYEEITDYMLAKHGLERDRLMRERDAQMAYDDYRKEHPKGKKTLQDFMDGLAGKDYAGLTALADGSQSVDRLRQDEETLTNQLRDTYDAPARNALIKQRDGVRRQLMEEARKEAEKMVADFEGKHDADGLWESVNHATKATLAKAYECGLTDKETYEKVKDMYEHYVPLRGFDEVTASDMYDYLNPERTGAGNVMIRAKGRKSKADDPIATIGNMADTAISRGNRNLVKQKFLMMVQNHPTDLANVNHVWLEERKATDASGNVTTEHVAVFPDIPHDATDEEALRMTEQFERDMEARRKAGEALIRADEKPDMPFRIDNKDLEREHQVIVYRAGKPFVVTMNGNPRAAQAMNGNPRAAQAMNGATNPDSPDNKVGRMYQKANRALAGMFTQWNVGFLVPNFVKDGIYANSMVELKEGHAYGVEYHKCWATAARHMRGVMKRMENGTLDMNNPIDRMFKEFVDNGGETGYTFTKSVDDYKKLIRKELRTMDSRSRQIWGKAVDSLEFYGNMMENVARFAAYMASRNSGRSISRSVFDAKDISVNFNKKGSGGRFAKGEPLLLQAAMLGSQYGRNFIVFWNAGVQGLANFLRIANVNKKKFAALAGSFYAAGFMMPVLQCLLGGDDDDYYDLPEHTRRQNICVKIPGTGWFAKIPLPIELRSLYGLGELCATYALGKENLSASKFALKAAEQMTQILPVDVVGEGGFSAFLPTLVKPAWEVHTNKSWTGLPIYREPYNGKYVPEWKKAYKSTSPLLVGMSKKLNEATGGNDYKSGVVDVNPAMVEHLVSGYFGGVGTVASQITKSAGMIYDEDMRDVRNVPVANRFVQQPSERAKEKRIDGMFYENKDVYEKVKVQLSGFKKEKAASKGNVTEYAEWQKKENDLKKTKEYKIYLVFKNKGKALKKRQDNYNKKGDDATRDVLYELKDEMNREVYEIGK